MSDLLAIRRWQTFRLWDRRSRSPKTCASLRVSIYSSEGQKNEIETATNKQTKTQQNQKDFRHKSHIHMEGFEVSERLIACRLDQYQTVRVLVAKLLADFDESFSRHSEHKNNSK